jgi:hypothetical protein
MVKARHKSHHINKQINRAFRVKKIKFLFYQNYIIPYKKKNHQNLG